MTGQPQPGPFVCVYHGSPDECQCCGGSASLGGTQEPLVTDVGTYCSTDCHDEIVERFYPERAT